jgi:hypothetical protein
LTYLERQKYYGPEKKILFKKQLSDLEVKGQGPTKVFPATQGGTYSDNVDCGWEIRGTIGKVNM